MRQLDKGHRKSRLKTTHLYCLKGRSAREGTSNRSYWQFHPFPLNMYHRGNWCIKSAPVDAYVPVTHFIHSERPDVHAATHYNTLQHTATHCNTLSHTATHCNTLHLQNTASSSVLVILICFLTDLCVLVMLI